MTSTPQADQRPPSLGFVGGVPLEVAIAAALVAAPGVYVLIDSLRALGDVFDIFDGSGRDGLAAITWWLASAGLGALLVWLAVEVLQGVRAARGGVYVLGGSWLLGYVLAPDLAVTVNVNGRGGAAITGFVCLIVAALVLALAPTAQTYFTRRESPHPATIAVLTRYGLGVAILLGICGMAHLLLYLGSEDKGAEGTVVGLVMLAAATIALVLQPQLARRAPIARLVGSVTMLAATIVAFALLGQRFFLTPPQLLAFLTVAWISLWAITDARAWFGDPPLQSSAQPTAATTHTTQQPSTPPPAVITPTIVGESVPSPERSTAVPTPTPDPFDRHISHVPRPPTVAPTDATADGDMVPCIRCSTPIAPDDRFCRGCGATATDVRPPPPPPTCGSCGHQLATGDRFCPACGARQA